MCGALVALLYMSLTSCDKINAWLDNPVTININLGGEGGANGENGEDSQSVPVKFTTAVEQLKIAEYEGAYITFWFTHKGGLYYAIFKKVGNDYVLQNDVASTRITDRAFTRGVEDEPEVPQINIELHQYVDDGGPTLFFGVEESTKKADGSTGTNAVLQTIIETQTGNIEQRTMDISSRVIAVETGIQAPDNIHVQRVESGAVNLMRRGEVPPEERGAVAVALNSGKIDTWMLENLKTNTGKITLNTIAEINQQVNQANGVTDVTNRADAGDLIKALEEAGKVVEQNLQTQIGSDRKDFIVTEFKILTNNMELEVGQSLQIEYKIGPDNADKTVLWTSSDEKVATVDKNGKVTALSEGTAKITVTPLNTRKSFIDNFAIFLHKIKRGTKLNITSPMFTYIVVSGGKSKFKRTNEIGIFSK